MGSIPRPIRSASREGYRSGTPAVNGAERFSGPQALLREGPAMRTMVSLGAAVFGSAIALARELLLVLVHGQSGNVRDRNPFCRRRRRLRAFGGGLAALSVVGLRHGGR